MDRTELYLKTAFCCMACDGEIAPEEIAVISEMPRFSIPELKRTLETYVNELKNNGSYFLRNYLEEVKNASLSEDEECQLASIAIQTIEADQSVEYSEVAFFKKIRKRLLVSDEKLLKVIPEESIMPDREDYLLPDIMEEDDLTIWADTFSNLQIEKNI